MARHTGLPDSRPRDGRSRRGTGVGRRAQPRPAAPDRGPTPRATALAVVLGLAIAASSFVVYGQLAHHDFIHFDDDIYIYDNPHVRTGLSWENVRWAFTEYRANTWHPMAWISHMLDCQLFGLDAGKHHLTSVVIHTLNSILLFLVLRRMTGALWRGAAVAAFFAVHPMHVESVAWASERKDVLSTLFALLTIWAYAAYARRPAGVRYLGVLALCALAVLSKPMMVTLPIVLLILDYWPLRRFGWSAHPARTTGLGSSTQTGRSPGIESTRRRARTAGFPTLLLEKVPMFALAAVSAVLTMMAERDLQQHALWMRAMTALVSLMRYAGKLLVPLTQAFYYPYPKEPPVVPALGCALLLVGVTWWFLHVRRTHPYAVTGWFWFVATLLPVIGLEQVATHAIADRYSYVPSIGLSIVVAWGLVEIARRRPQGPAALAVVAALGFVATAARARTQAGYWENGITLFSRDIQVVRDNTLGWRNLGVALCDAGRYEEAIPMFENVLRVYPYDAVSEFGIGSALENLGRLPEAAEHYRASLRSAPNRSEAHYNLGNVLGRLGRADEAIEQFRTAVRLQPDFAPAHNNLGNFLSKAERYSEAIASYQEAIRRSPGYAEAYNNLGTVYRKLGRLDDALSGFSAALRLRPDFAAAEFNAGIVHLMQGDSSEARRRFAAAERLDPGLAANVPPQLREALIPPGTPQP